MSIVILVRKPNRWVKYATALSMEEAERIFKERISGRGITAWTEFVTENESEKMLKELNSLAKNKRID